MFQVTYITASTFAKTKTFMSVDTWFHTISSHTPQSNRSVLQLEKKKNNCSTCKHMQTVPNLHISAMGSSDDAAAWSGLWVINQVGGSSIDLFTLLVAQAK